MHYKDSGKKNEDNTYSVSANYGYSDKRQTNFATIGEGTIIVRDGKTDMSKLNRDVTKAQYTTVDVGLSGGIKVDSATINMLTSPIQTAENLKNALVQGFNDGRATTEKVVKNTVEIYERTTNLIMNDDESCTKGFYTNKEVTAIKTALITFDVTNQQKLELSAGRETMTDTGIPGWAYAVGFYDLKDKDAFLNGIKNYNIQNTGQNEEFLTNSSSKVILYDQGNNTIKDEYYRVRDIDTKDAMSYKEASRITGGDMKLGQDDMVRDVIVTDSKILSNLYSDDKNQQLIAVVYNLNQKENSIYNALKDTGLSDSEARGQTILTVASTLLENTSIKYGDKQGNLINYDATMADSNKATYFFKGDWDDGIKNNEGIKTPLANYKGNDGQPKADCAALTGLVLDTGGVRNGTAGKNYGEYKGLNATGNAGKGTGVENIVNSSVLTDINSGQVKLGNIAYSGNKDHILIVSEVQNGKAANYIHSSSWNYNSNSTKDIGWGLQNSPYNSSNGIFYKQIITGTGKKDNK